MRPKPICRALSNPILKNIIDLPHGGIDVGLHIVGLWCVKGGVENLFEMGFVGAVVAANNARHHNRCFLAARQFYKSRRGSRVAAKKINRVTGVKALIDQTGNGCASLHELNHFACTF